MRLSDAEYQQLLEVALGTHEARTLRRALALLWLHEGDDVDEVADRLLVTRQTVYRWVKRCQEHPELEMAVRVADRPRPGRPRTVHDVIDPLISQALKEDPRKLGYKATVWTAPLLCQYLQEVHQVEASRRSLGLAIERLDLVWKRPRYDLARRSPTWRQAKGGSNGALPSANAPSF